MINNIHRIGNFTSSEIAALTKEGKAKGTFGAPALTYIAETNMERRLGRSLTDEINAKPLLWGKLLETKVFDLLGLEYVLTSQETKLHPSITYWAGSKDGCKFDTGGTVIDMKCPINLKSFCQLVDPLYKGLTGMNAMNAIRENHKDGEKYYWQLVSNSIIEDCQFAELIVYVPYKSELPDVKMLAQNSDTPEKFYWLMYAGEDELPFLVDRGYYKNLNTIRFEVPQEDKDFLTEKVEKAGKLLEEIQPSVLVAEYLPNERLTLVN